MREGRLLELIIAQLQIHLAPKGFAVYSPGKFRDADGVSVGEVDIVLEGELGAAQFRWGFECRDRPSAGPIGRSWIRELMGKRDDLGLDKIIAVSTSGFAKTARDLAETERIDLWHVRKFDDSEILRLLPTITFQKTDDTVKFQSVDLSLDFDGSTPREVQALPLMLRNGAPIIKLGQRTNYNLLELLYEHLNSRPDLKRDLREKPGWIHIPGPFVVERFILKEIAAKVYIETSVTEQELLFSVCERLSDNKTLAYNSHFRMPFQGHDATAIAIITQDRNDSHWGKMNLTFYDEKGERIIPNPGFCIDLWGIREAGGPKEYISSHGTVD